ncbi:MAG TPA: cell wall-binding repeat-containing protein [Candidatus Limnocylindria bacterium]|nr:cell wall-binding repeat-containing protein [Candidatus Limnocylindria bacterium]
MPSARGQRRESLRAGIAPRFVSLVLAGMLAASSSPVAGTPGPGSFEPRRDPGTGDLVTPAALQRVPVPEPERPEARTAPGEILVRFAAGVPPARAEAVLEGHGARAGRELPAIGFRLARVRSGSVEQVVARLRADPRVDAASPNYLRTAAADPNDMLFVEGDQHYYLDLHRFREAWAAAPATPGPVIAILDSGVDRDHPDLADRLLSGIDLVNQDADPSDDSWHGTFVAGVAGAIHGNRRGGVGAANNARLLPVKVLRADLTGTDADVAEGIVWATDHGADIVNLSLGGYGDSPALRAAVDYALSHDVVVVAAAGNDAADEPNYPAAYPGVVAVAATDWEGDIAWFSNHGGWVDVASTGHDVISSYPAAGAADSYAIGSGTSFAAPLVAGAVALARARDPGLGQAALVERLLTTARDAGPQGIDPYYGRGLLDAAALLGAPAAAAVRPPPGDPSEPNGTPDRARPLPAAPNYSWGTISPQGDEDWYSVSVSSPSRIDFELGANPPQGRGEEYEAMVEILDPQLRTVVGPTFAGAQAHIYLDYAPAGTYRIRVWNVYPSRSPLQPGAPWGYTIRASVGAPVGTSISPGATAWIRDVTPAHFALGLAGGVAPTIEFARAVEPVSVTPQTIRLTDASTGQTVTGSVTYDVGSRTATVRPGTTLAASRPYVVTVANVRDTAGNSLVQPYSFRFTVGTLSDARPPETRIVRGPYGGALRDAFFDFVADEPGVEFECSGNGGSWHRCAPPYGWGFTPEGSNSVAFRAVDAAGNVDATPARRSWPFPPSNDDWAAAQAVSGDSGTTTGITRHADSEAGEPLHAGPYAGRSIWYRWTAPASGRVVIDTIGSDYDTVVGVYTGAAVDALRKVVLSDDAFGTLWSEAAFDATAGTTYSIALSGGVATYPGSGHGVVNWRLDRTAPPSTPSPSTSASPTPSPSPSPSASPSPSPSPSPSASPSPSPSPSASPSPSSSASPSASPSPSGTVTRLDGPDRYAGAARISQFHFAPGVPVAFVTTGENYPDALSAGPAAAKLGGPVLLVRSGSIPTPIAAELTRLRPGRIVIVGGSASVSTAVESALRRYTTGSVTRIAGPDRYAAAAGVSAAHFAPGVPVAYVATGEKFPDALAGVPPAAKAGAPVLLVRYDGIPTSIGAELTRLKPGRIVILGGTGSVAASLEAALDRYTTGSVTRITAADRYLGAVAISQAHFAAAGVAYVATGTNFPDALAGGPPAGIARAPILLVPGGTVPSAVKQELLRLGVKQVVILGGTGSVSSGVEAELRALLGG